MTLTRTLLLFSVLTVLLVPGCLPAKVEGRFIEEPERAPLIASWSLLADADEVLVDPAIPGSGYPNIGDYQVVEVNLHEDGLVCGQFLNDGRVVRDACGGPAQGLPYVVVPDVQDELLRLRVIDVFGNDVRTSAPLADACFRPGTCGLCSDVDGRIVSDPCNLAAPADEAETPTQEMEMDTNCFVQGAQAFIDYANHELARIDMPSWNIEPEGLVAPPEGHGPIEPPPGITVIRVGVPRAMHATENICATYGAGERRVGPKGRFDEDYLISEDRVRCGFLANDALVEGCEAEPTECNGEQRMDYELGLLSAFNAWSGGDGRGWGWIDTLESAVECPPEDPECEPGQESPELPECAGSPLVVSLDDEAVALSSMDEGVSFDLMGTGDPVRTGWLRHGAFLALDRDFDGRISSGRELFGEATVDAVGKRYADGFEALAVLDSVDWGGNENGEIDKGDRLFPRLRLWSDHNRDGRSQAGELSTLATAGIAAIALASQSVEPADFPPHPGGIALLQADVRWDSGRVSSIYDVWLTYRARSSIVAVRAQRTTSGL